tara:strand:- start:78 stop:755 length:678 start_codon:yes stop_codon:yes gene_type:complete
MNPLLITGIVIFSIALLPNVFASIYVNDEPYLFSIEYPDNFTPTRATDFLEDGTNIDKDETGRSGFWIGLWKGQIQEELADYKIMEILKEDSKYFCESANFAEHYARCFNHVIVDTEISTIDGFRAFTVFEKYTLELNGKDPKYPNAEAGRFDTLGSATYVISYDDVWVIASSFDKEDFDKNMVIDTINSFKLQNIVKEEIQPSVTTESSWIDDLIKTIMSLFKF